MVASLVRWLAILTPRTVLLECYAEGFNSVINRRVRHMEPLGNSRAEQIPRRRRGKESFFTRPVLDFSTGRRASSARESRMMGGIL